MRARLLAGAALALAAAGCASSTSGSSTATRAAAKPSTPIRILSPHDGSRTSADHIAISGTAAPDQTLAYLDDPGATGLQSVKVGSNAEWTINAPLAMGQNSIEFVGKGSNSPSVTITRVAAAPPPHHAPASTSTQPAAPAPPSGPPVTGFGATDAAWNANHTPDSDFDPGAVYNPDPSLPQVNGHPGADYTQVMHQDGHVLGYDYHFTNEPIDQAKAQTLSQNFPSDAHTLWFVVKDTCAQMLVQSDAVGQALSAPSIGDSGGFVLVEFGSGINEDSYDSSAVSDALFMLAQDASQADAPGC
jgi:hypothetical protein